MDQVLLVMTNVPDTVAADSIANLLLERRLAACINFLPGVKSRYRWQGRLEQADEITLLIKTTVARYEEVQVAIVSAHPYQTPEIIATSVANGWPPYLNWIVEETK